MGGLIVLKIKNKSKSNMLALNCKLGKGDFLLPIELDVINDFALPEFINAAVQGQEKLAYSTPCLKTLDAYLSGGLYKPQFFTVVLNVVDMLFLITEKTLNINNVFFGLEYIAVSSATQLRFVYAPVSNSGFNNNVFGLFYDIISRTVCLDNDRDFTARFGSFLQKQTEFSFERVLEFVDIECPGLIDSLNLRITGGDRQPTAAGSIPNSAGGDDTVLLSPEQGSGMNANDGVQNMNAAPVQQWPAANSIPQPINQVNEIPNQINAIPNQVNEIPNQINPIPNQVNEIPNQINPIPNQVNEIPNQINAIPNQVNEIPNQINAIPNQVNEIPNQINPIPNQVNEIPNQINAIPNQVNEIPNQINAIPNQVNDMPEAGFGVQAPYAAPPVVEQVAGEEADASSDEDVITMALDDETVLNDAATAESIFNTPAQVELNAPVPSEPYNSAPVPSPMYNSGETSVLNPVVDNEINSGNTVLLVQPTPIKKKLLLVFPRLGKNITVEGGEFKIGSDPAYCNFAIPNTNVSRVHLIITFDGADYYANDKGSTNGTMINGASLKNGEPVKLNNYDRVILANEIMNVQVLED